MMMIDTIMCDFAIMCDFVIGFVISSAKAGAARPNETTAASARRP
jgi:hypothetical protein